MCLIAFAIDASPRWPVVIAANRDEFLDRPTLPLACWHTASGRQIISGRDLRAGGTWLGATPEGRVAFLTNVRQGHPLEAPRSRGELVTRWLQGDDDASSFAAVLQAQRSTYAGFNLVIGDVQRKTWLWMTNRTAAAEEGWRAQVLGPGVYGLSNAALDTPWPKTVALKQALVAALATSGATEALQASLWAALANRQRAAQGELPQSSVSPALEQALSSAFVETPEYSYGTRSSTVLLMSSQKPPELAQSWTIQMEERTYLRQALKDLAAAQIEVHSDFAIDGSCLPFQRKSCSFYLAA